MKQRQLLLVFMLLLVAGVTPAFSQKRVTGKVTGANGQPVVGATVAAPGTNTATQTNSDGIFSLSVPNGVQRLTVSSVGFSSRDVSINGKSNISIALTSSTTQLTEVVVTALGVKETEDLFSHQ